ncbi:LCP family protein [Candidatus Saccharibacteria bacterium]|nr:LCP family protein [Candidatus Saccharibacteria bacterium]
MVKKVKYVDGFTPKKATGRQNRTVGFGDKPKKTRRNGSRAAKTTQSTMHHPRARRIAIEDFSAPVNTLDLNSEQIDKDLQRQALKESGGKKRKNKKGEKKEKKKWSTKRKVLTVFIIVLVLILAGGVAFFLWGQGILNKLSNGKIGLWDIITAKDVELKKDANGRTNLLVLGTSGYDMGGSEHDGAQLTDSIMILSLDQETKDIAMLSLPRDLYVGDTCTATGKINEIYWCNNQDGTNEEAGVRAAMEEIGEILGIDFQYYAHINWGALVQVVDALGGVTVTLDEDIADDWTETYITAGVPTTLNGEQALGLARARHGTESGDFTRGNSQQKILIAIKDKMVENGLSLVQVMDLMGAVGDNVRTDFNADEVKTIYNLMRDFPLENLRHIALLDPENNINYVTTGSLGNGISYVLPTAGNTNYTEIQKYLRKILSSDGMQREGAEILVLNGTDTVGVAGVERQRLEEKGFYVAQVDDIQTGVCAAKYCVYDLSEGKMPVSLEKIKEFYGVTELEDGKVLSQYYYSLPYDFVVIVGESNNN